MKPKPPRCPHCASQQVVPIVYGYPSIEMAKKAEQGKLLLGGCCITGSDPEWHCKDCLYRWKQAEEI